MRHTHRRENYIPPAALEIRDEHSSAVVYAYPINTTGRLGLTGFHGRAQKPDFRYAFREESHRQEYQRQFFKRWREYEQTRRIKPRDLAVGDVLKSSWGYDQTNVDFYEVTGLVGEQMVELRPIEQESCYDGQSMTGKAIPLPGKFTGDTFRRRADGDSVKITSYAFAWKLEQIMVDGVLAFPASAYSDYA